MNGGTPPPKAGYTDPLKAGEIPPLTKDTARPTKAQLLGTTCNTGVLEVRRILKMCEGNNWLPPRDKILGMIHRSVMEAQIAAVINVVQMAKRGADLEEWEEAVSHEEIDTLIQRAFARSAPVTMDGRGDEG